jgi:uncharacterized protein YjeT (DUF2065 family)
VEHILQAVAVVLARVVEGWGPAHSPTQAVDVLRRHTEHILRVVAVVLACVARVGGEHPATI